jgi:3,4-dihydroxy 2-butanone 4-phosphate synthase/GTP cyclohydrolase II
MSESPADSLVPGGISAIEEALDAIAAGRMVVVVDSPHRENEGDLIMAADAVTPEAINFMATHGRGLICAALTQERLTELGIGPMVADSTDPKGTAFHVSVDHRRTSTTGISARDRANTIAALASRGSKPEDFTRPGHVFPLGSRDGGVLTRAGHTEAAVDLSRLAGRAPAGILCEIAGADGEMARLPRLLEFAREHGLPLITIAALIFYRRRRERLVVRVSEARVPLDAGEFRAIGFRDVTDGMEHVAFVMGDVTAAPDPLVRVHSECLTGDVFGSRRCDCGRQLQLALRAIADAGCGAVVYLRGHEGRGIGLLAKLDAYQLQDSLGLDTVDANLQLGFPVDRRDYATAMQILRDLGVSRVRLMTNNPAKRMGLEAYGVTVSQQVPLITAPTPDNLAYLDAKRRRLGHVFSPEPADMPFGTGS